MILIVDDRQENIYSLQKLLALHQFEVDTALSGEEALKKILRNDYALIILDVQMPGMDGFEVAESIAGCSRSRDIPIIFLSAVNTDKRFIARGYSSGAIDYVTKPFDPDILLLKIKTFYRLREQTKELDDMRQSLELKVAERTRELQRSNQELEASNHELQQFAWVASHDLKEPLRKIQVLSHMVKDKFLCGNPEAVSHMERIIGSSARMTTLITDVLKYSSLSMHHSFVPTDLNLVLDEIMGDLELLIREKQAHIRADHLPVVEAIPAQMRQVFQNIISNALKFCGGEISPAITVSSHAVSDLSFDAPPSPTGQYYRIEISDNGIGFDEVYLHKIFSIFQRLHTRQAYEGTGIGLAIVKKITEGHHGIVTATSREGKGSTFIVILPLVQPVHSPKEEK